MRYTIVWLPAAVEELLAIWLSAPDRSAVTAAADELDSVLKIDPVLRGETLVGSVRILLADPLQAAYRVFDDDRIVQIIGIARTPPDDDED